MLPSKIIGSVILPGGCQPFVLDTPSGRVRVGKYADVDPDQGLLGSDENGAVKRQVEAEVSAVREVRVGSYRCPKCERWVDVVKSPSEWSGDCCANC